MKKVLLLFLCFAMFICQSGLAAIYIDDTSFYYFFNSPYCIGMSSSSTLTGYEGSESVYITSNEFIVKPMLVQSGKYAVWFYNVPWTNNYQKPVLRVKYDGGEFETQDMDHKTGTTGFYSLGTYEFKAGQEGSVSIGYPAGVDSSMGNSYVRFNCVKLELVEGYDEYIDVDLNQTINQGTPVVKTLQNKQVDLPSINQEAVKIYVSAGAVGGDGSEQSPFSTPIQARDKARELIKQAYPENGIAILIKGGTYELSDTLTLNQEDSGTQEQPIIYQAYDGQVVFTTGSKILPSEVKAVTDPHVLEKLQNQVADKIKVIDLAEKGITVAKIAPAKNQWTSVSLPDALTIDGQTYGISQYPNIGEVQLGLVQDASGRGTNEQKRDKGSSFSFREIPRILEWQDETDIIVNGKFSLAYQMESTMVANIDTQNMIISVLKGATLYNQPRPNAVFKNLLREIDMPGEFYVDRENGKLYFYPISQIKSDSDILFNFEKKTAINFNSGAENIVFKGISVKMAGNIGVEFAKEAKDCMFAGGEIAYTTANAAVINGSNIIFRDNNIHSIGTTGVVCKSGENETGTKGNVIIENNTITNTGTAGTTAMHGMEVTGCGNVVRNNHIYDIKGQAITWNGMGQLIEKNLVERVCTRFTDAGAIYTASGYVQDTIIRNNIIRDVLSEKGGAENRGIYFDNGTMGTVVAEGNIIKNSDTPFTLTGTRLTLKNNLIIMDEKVQHGSIGSMTLGGTLTHSNGKTPTENTFFKNYDIQKLSENFPNAVNFIQNGNPDINQAKKAFNNVFYNFKDSTAENSFTTQINAASFKSNGGEASDNIFLQGKPNKDDFSDVDWEYLAGQNNFIKIEVDEIGLYKGGMRQDDSLTYNKNTAQDFRLFFPEDKAEGLDTEITLEWENIYNMSYGEAYLYIAENPEFTDNLKIYDIVSNSISITFRPGTTYYWTVSANAAYLDGYKLNVGGVHSFTTKSNQETVNDEMIKAITLIRNTTEGNGFLQFKAGSKSLLNQCMEQLEEVTDVAEKAIIIKDAVNQYLKAQNTNSLLSTYLYEDFSNDIIGDRSLSFFIRNSVKDTPALVAYEEDGSNNKVTRMYSDERSATNPYNAQTTFPNQSGYVEIYTSMMVETAGISACMQIMTPEVDVYNEYRAWEKKTGAMVIFSRDGNIYSNFEKDMPSMKYEIGRWYDVLIKANVAEREYAVYIDGEQLASKIPFTASAEECSTLGMIVFSETEGNDSSRNKETGSFCIDNIIVRAPRAYGHNSFLSDLKLNGQTIAGFSPTNYLYTLNMSQQEISNTHIQAVTKDGARASVYDKDGKKYIAVMPANQNNVKVYTISGHGG